MKEKMKWKKIGGGSLRMNGRLIKRGEIFIAAKEDIPRNFWSRVIVVGHCDTEEVEPQTERVQPAYEIRQSIPEEEPEFEIVKKPFGWCDIINTQTGKTINEKKLRMEEAEEMLGALTGNDERD